MGSVRGAGHARWPGLAGGWLPPETSRFRGLCPDRGGVCQGTGRGERNRHVHGPEKNEMFDVGYWESLIQGKFVR